MKTANEILTNIKDGKPFSYAATLNKKRIYTIESKELANGVKYLVLSANNLKTQEVLTESQALNIITNTL